MTIETFDSLWAYCTANNRLVPMPPEWCDVVEAFVRVLPEEKWVHFGEI
jgi:hypothetical protein